jgi:hypothetical protein
MVEHFDGRDLQHVMTMVLLDNKGQVLTEAMCLGIEASVFHYLRVLPSVAPADETPQEEES